MYVCVLQAFWDHLLEVHLAGLAAIRCVLVGLDIVAAAAAAAAAAVAAAWCKLRLGKVFA